MQRSGFWQFPPPPRGPVRDPRELLPWMGVRGALSVGDLIEAGSLDSRLAALLWALLARRSSLIVAAGPRLAGKSTTLAALLEMVPPGVAFYPIGGDFSRSELSELRGLAPQEVYLVVNEVSEHIPGHYLWGEGVRELLRARAEGYPFAATLHAVSPRQVAALFAEPPLAIAPDLLNGLDLVLVLRDGYYSPRGIETVVLAQDLDAGARVAFEVLSRWDPERRAFRHTDAVETARILAPRLGLPAEAIEAELDARESYLNGLLASPPAEGLRAALARFSV